MVNWQVMAKTNDCDAVDDVRIIVNKYWTATFTGHRSILKYVKDLDKEKVMMLKREAKRMGRNLRCEEPLRCKSADHRDRLVALDKAIPAWLD